MNGVEMGKGGVTYIPKGLGVTRIGCHEAEDDALEAGAMVVNPVWGVQKCCVRGAA